MPSFNWRLALQSGYSPEEIQAHLDKRGLSDEALIQRQLSGKPMLPYSYAPDLDMPPPAAAPPPLMSGPPASVPGSVPQTGERRDMSPQEIDALWGEQGIQPVLTPPMSLKDLAMEPAYSFLTEAELPPALLQTVRYKRPGVSALARQAAELYHRTPRVDPIGRKATVFHATDPLYVENILQSGKIAPGNISDDPGVSVSRVPRVASKGTRAVSFVIDPEKMPPSRPYAEEGYAKTHGDDNVMSPRFEFEDRTYNQPIPTSAVREMWVDRSALPTWELTGPREPALQRIRALSEQYGIPLREFKTGREMHRGRLSDLAKKKRK